MKKKNQKLFLKKDQYSAPLKVGIDLSSGFTLRPLETRIWFLLGILISIGSHCEGALHLFQNDVMDPTLKLVDRTSIKVFFWHISSNACFDLAKK